MEVSKLFHCVNLRDLCLAPPHRQAVEKAFTYALRCLAGTIRIRTHDVNALPVSKRFGDVESAPMHLPTAQRSEATLRRVALSLSVPNDVDLREHLRSCLLRIFRDDFLGLRNLGAGQRHTEFLSLPRRQWVLQGMGAGLAITKAPQIQRRVVGAAGVEIGPTVELVPLPTLGFAIQVVLQIRRRIGSIQVRKPRACVRGRRLVAHRLRPVGLNVPDVRCSHRSPSCEPSGSADRQRRRSRRWRDPFPLRSR